MGSALLVMQKKHYRKLNLLQVSQDKTFLRGPPPSVAQWTKQGNAALSSELPRMELDLAAQPWPAAELFSGRTAWQVARRAGRIRLCLQAVVAAARSFHF